ncbi:PAS domain S-box protein [Methanoculleus sp. FWC-SCC1]|uniref:PAS domain S-box protein n=1 Tax=Methanoculleus frigidifontis TaxID=2584085 RepID=A0ABT8MAF5_9EURY|nr:PAS domain S-box protein [Methanoculleus sp. FWC-SCC1]MDN7024884.1 PAS domain S-box protein [Methanoculleus sp. FWC-SCC1]
MQEEHDIQTRILRALRFRPKGMTITDVAKQIGATRGSAAKRLEILQIAGRVDVRSIGNAKVYSLAQRVPMSAFLCFTKNLILILDETGRIVQVNDQCLRALRRSKDDLIGLTLEEAALPVISSPEAIAVIEGLEREQVVTDLRYRSDGKDFFYQMQAIPTTFDDGETGATLVLEDITERKQYVRNMEFLARTGRDFRDMGEGDDIYEYVALQVYSLAPGFLVWVGILDESNQNLVLKSVVGNPIALDTMHRLMGVKLEGMTFPISTADTAALIQYQTLVRTPPLYRLLHMQVPEEICRQIKEIAGGIDSCLMGLVSKARIVGDVVISLSSGANLPNRDLIEAFIRQAAIAIDRKIADDSLRQSLEREQEQVRNLLFLSRTAMELVDMPAEADLYQYVADRIDELIPDARVFVVSYDEGNWQFFMQAIADENFREGLKQSLGFDIVGMAFPIGDLFGAPYGEALPALFTSREHIFRPTSEASGWPIYDVCFRQIPEEICDAILSRFNIGKLSSIRLAWANRLFGIAGIFLPPGEVLEHRQVIELFLQQASIALARRQTENRLRRSEARFRDVIDSSPVAAAIIESDGRYSFLNRAFTDLFGYTLADIPTGREWFRQAFPDAAYRREAIAAWKADREENSRGAPRPRTFSVRCKSGEEKAILFRPVELCDGTEHVTYEDVTEDRRAYRVLVEEIARLQRQVPPSPG